jgi:hypothetical protein
LPLFAGLHYTHKTFPLSELHRYKRDFAFIKGERTVRLDPEDPANEKAYLLMCNLHDNLEAGGFTGGDLERLLVRLLFCLFAEDTEVFEPNTFTTFLREQTREDGSDLGAQLNELFDRLNTPKERWPAANADKYANFKYVNGRLFADRLGYPSFTKPMRVALLAAADYQWQKVSPAVFGSLFQGIKDAVDRRQQGAHYTSERDIMKVVRSLFLDDLRSEFAVIVADRSTRRIARLQEFHTKLRSLRFFDPACGCGNFLVIAYRELRLLIRPAIFERAGTNPSRRRSVPRHRIGRMGGAHCGSGNVADGSPNESAGRAVVRHDIRAIAAAEYAAYFAGKCPSDGLARLSSARSRCLRAWESAVRGQTSHVARSGGRHQSDLGRFERGGFLGLCVRLVCEGRGVHAGDGNSSRFRIDKFN